MVPVNRDLRAVAPTLHGITRLLGFDADFTFWDKIVSGGIFFWSMFWLAVVVVGSAWNLISRWNDEVWATYWFVVGLVLPVAVAAVTLVWFAIGGFVDLRLFFQRLRSMKRDARDDGSVGEYGPYRDTEGEEFTAKAAKSAKG